MSEQGFALPAEVATLVEKAVTRAVSALPAYSSPQIDQIAAALAVAQSKMFSPARNRSVTVKPKNSTITYDFRYSTLDVINDMIREPLAESGLSHLHLLRPNRHGELYLYTRLLHSSGQYMDSIMPLSAAFAAMADENSKGWQGVGSAIQYAKRYNLSALLGIASQADDDANIIDGNVIEDHSQPVDPGTAVRVLHDSYARLVGAAVSARDAASVGEVMQRWQTGMRYWMRMRDQPGYAEHWERMLRLIPEALRRVHGTFIAEAWETSVRARTPEQIATLREQWETADGKAERARMKGVNPISYGMLYENLRLQAARVQNEVEEAARRERSEAARREQLAIVDEEIETEPSPFAGPAAAPAPDVEPAIDEPAAAETTVSEADEASLDDAKLAERQLRDEFGELLSEPYGEAAQVEFIRDLLELHADAEFPDALLEHNADGIAWATRNPAAAAEIVQLLEVRGPRMPAIAAPAAAAEPAPPHQVEPPPVAAAELPVTVEQPAAKPVEGQLSLLPTPTEPETEADDLVDTWKIPLLTNSRGKPDLQAYVRAVRLSLDRTGPGDVDDWSESNQETLESLPASTQSAIKALLIQRRLVLGMDEAA